MTAAVRIDHAARLGVLLRKPKRFKIIVGGRASTKSTFVADYVLSQISLGKVWGCGREFQNSIDESVHALLAQEIERLGLPGFDVQATHIKHSSGGESFYRGLARNLTGLKSMICNGFWVEEAESMSADSLKMLTASVRASAKEQTDAERAGTEVSIPEVWFTMNRRSRKDPISKRFLERAEADLERYGYYEDDVCIIIEINYDENPWFEGSGLEQERADDEKNLSRAAYEHKWLGKYSDTIENAIIEPDWFDACVDAHLVLGFKPEGMEVCAFDPFDGGDDAAALAYRHGNVILEAEESRSGRVNDSCDWALDFAQMRKPDVFVWDSNGVGAALKRPITQAFEGKKVLPQMFEGQAAIDMPDSIYEPVGVVAQQKRNRDMFYNRRAQRYWSLRDRIYRTFLAVQDKKFADPSTLISFSSNIKLLSVLRTELCRIPRKHNGQGKIQIMSKEEMRKEGIPSPNLADCVMMTEDAKSPPVARKPINFQGWG